MTEHPPITDEMLKHLDQESKIEIGLIHKHKAADGDIEYPWEKIRQLIAALRTEREKTKDLTNYLNSEKSMKEQLAETLQVEKQKVRIAKGCLARLDSKDREKEKEYAYMGDPQVTLAVIEAYRHEARKALAEIEALE